MTEGKKMLKSLIRFHSANKINNYKGEQQQQRRGKGEKKKRKKSKESTEQVKT